MSLMKGPLASLMNDMITADFGTLLDQSKMTADDYLGYARGAIDRRFGEGYAAKNPQLVAAFMQVAGSDFQTSSTLKVLEAGLQRLADRLSEVADSLADRCRAGE